MPMAGRILQSGIGPGKVYPVLNCQTISRLLMALWTLWAGNSIAIAGNTPSKGEPGGMPAPVLLSVKGTCDMGALATPGTCAGNYCEVNVENATASVRIDVFRSGSRVTYKTKSVTKEDSKPQIKCSDDWPSAPHAETQLMVPPPYGLIPLRWQTTANSWLFGYCCNEQSTYPCNSYRYGEPEIEEGIIRGVTDCENNPNAIFNPETCECEELKGSPGGSPSLRVPGPGGVHLRTGYDSQTGFLGPLGIGWTHNYDMVVRLTAYRRANVSWEHYYYQWIFLENGSSQTGFGYWLKGNGSISETFVPNGPWKSATQGVDNLGNPSYILTRKTGEKFEFWEHEDPDDPSLRLPAPGYPVESPWPVKRYELQRIRDRDGTVLVEMEYRQTTEAQDELARVIDFANGRMINLIDTDNDKLVDVLSYPLEDARALNPLGSKQEENEEWTFVRDEQLRLLEILMPGGMKERFQYANIYSSVLPEEMGGDWTDNLVLKQDARGVGSSYSYQDLKDELASKVSLTGKRPWARERLKVGAIEEGDDAGTGADYETVFWTYRDGVACVRSNKSKTKYAPRIGVPGDVTPLLAYVVTSETTEWRDEEHGTEVLDWNGEAVTGFSRTQRYDYGWDYSPYLDNGSTLIEQTLRTDWLTCSEDVLGRKRIYTYWDDPDTPQYGSLKRVLTADGLVTYHEYNDFDLPTITVLDEGVTDLQTVNAYNTEGKIISTTVPFGDADTATVHYLYTDDGDIQEIRSALWTSGDPLVRKREFLYYGQGEEGGVNRELKDVLSRVRLDWEDPQAPVETMRIRYRYTPLGRVEQLEDALGRITDIEYNEAGSRAKIILPPKSPGETRPQIGTLYDLSGNLTTVTDPLGHETVSHYGLDNELEWVQIPIDDNTVATTRYTFNDQLELTQVEDAEGRKTNYSFDSLGRLVSVTDPFDRKTEFVFDKADRLEEKIDARGKHTFLEYDPQTDRLTKEVFEDGSLEHFYDRLGRRERVSYTDAQGVTRDVETVAYYRDGSVKEVSDCCGRVHKYTYLKDGTVNTHTFSRDGDATTEWTQNHAYDELGRPVQMKRIFGDGEEPAEEQVVRTWYNLSGTIAELEYPNGSVSVFEYDDLDRVTLMVNYAPDGMTVLSSFEYEYDLASRRTRITREDGTYTKFDYNHAGWLTLEARYDDSGTPQDENDDELIWQDELSYDLVGNRTEKRHTEAIETGGFDITVQCYKYNQGNQLVLEWKEQGDLGLGTVIGKVGDKHSGLKSITVSGTPATTWGEDFYGEGSPSSTGHVVVIAEDNVGNQTIVPVKVDTSLSDFVFYSYDENGNLSTRMSSDGPIKYEWDTRNRLTKVIHPDGQETSYSYCEACPLGKLAKMTRKDGSTVEWAWDGISLIEENDSRDALPTEVLGSLAVKKNGSWYYLHTDVMGTVWQITDEMGQVVNTFDWDCWGNELSGSFTDGSAVCQIGWQGKRWDEEQGVFYSVARWYDQRLGRFTQVDPVEGFGMVTTGGEGYGWPGRGPSMTTDRSGRSEGGDDVPTWNPAPSRSPDSTYIVAYLVADVEGSTVEHIWLYNDTQNPLGSDTTKSWGLQEKGPGEVHWLKAEPGQAPRSVPNKKWPCYWHKKGHLRYGSKKPCKCATKKDIWKCIRNVPGPALADPATGTRTGWKPSVAHAATGGCVGYAVRAARVCCLRCEGMTAARGRIFLDYP